MTSGNITIELQGRHPTLQGYVDSANDGNFTEIDCYCVVRPMQTDKEMMTRRTVKSLLSEEREIRAWISENKTFELQDRHPTSTGYVDRTNDHNITRLNTALTNAQPPTQAPTGSVRLAIL